MNAILCALATAYLVVLFARVLMSWFPIRPGTAAASIYIVLRDITEPVLAPLRRVIPPAGFIDLSVLVLFVALGILRGILCS